MTQTENDKSPKSENNTGHKPRLLGESPVFDAFIHHNLLPLCISLLFVLCRYYLQRGRNRFQATAAIEESTIRKWTWFHPN